MSLEAGGRADKIGNKFENHFLAKKLLELFDGKLTQIIVEPVGKEGSGIEFVTIDKSSNKRYYQCKTSNGINNHWTPSTLNEHKVFSTAKMHIFESDANHYYFVSPIPYNGLDDLCNHARQTTNAKIFLKEQVISKRDRELLRACIKYIFLGKEYDDNDLVNFLSRCHFEVALMNDNETEEFESRLGIKFRGNQRSIRILLENYINDERLYGKPVSGKDIMDYLGTHGIQVREYANDENILCRIKTINDLYPPYRAINNTIIHREITDVIFDKLKEGHFIILQGKAGVGKSGCLEDLIKKIKDESILFLKINLQDNRGATSSHNLGKALGLPESPVKSISTVSGKKKCILLFDQLDSIRWANEHSSVALQICKEMIKEAIEFKKDGFQISLLFSCRTIDLENDLELQALFDEKSEDNNITWDKLEIKPFTAGDLNLILGEKSNHIPKRLKELLLLPSCLYIWTLLDDSSKKNTIRTSIQLIQRWWEQLLRKGTRFGFKGNEIVDCKDAIIKTMSGFHTSSLLRSSLMDFANELDFLISNGLLNSTQEGKITFVHQSFLDYFLGIKIFEAVCEKKDIKEIVGGINEQTPSRRYIFMFVLQNIWDMDKNNFIEFSNKILASSDVRFYFKCAIFEVLSQMEEEDDDILSFAYSLYTDPVWHDIVLNTVFRGHKIYIKYLNVRLKPNWLYSPYSELIISINEEDPDFVENVLSHYAFKDTESDKKILRMLCYNPVDDSDKMFLFRLKLLRETNLLSDHFSGIHYLLKDNPARAIEFFISLLESDHNDKERNLHQYLGEEDLIISFAEDNCVEIVNQLLPVIYRVTQSIVVPWPINNYDYNFRKWLHNKYEQSVYYNILRIVEIAFKSLIDIDLESVILILNNANSSMSIITNEIYCYAISALPNDYADYAIDWLLDNFRQKAFAYIADQNDYLKYTKEILAKFTPYCTKETYQRLESVIYHWQEKNAKEIYRNRISENKIGGHELQFTPFWGYLQKELLPILSDENGYLSNESKDLINVLRRNKDIKLPFYYCFSHCETGFLKSPLDDHLNNISNKSWLKIISTPMQENRKICANFIEVTPYTFSRSLYSSAFKEPARFAALVQSFPLDCYDGYILSVLDALGHQKSLESVIEEPLFQNLIRYCFLIKSEKVRIAALRLIPQYGSLIWRNDILAFLYQNSQVQESEYNDQKLSFALFEASLNSEKSCIYYAIASILRNNEGYFSIFKDIIISASRGYLPITSFGILDCICACFAINKEFSIQAFQTLLKNNPQIIITQQAWKLIRYTYQDNSSFYRVELLSASSSNDENLIKKATSDLCALLIIYNDERIMEWFNNNHHNVQQIDAMCSVLISFLRGNEDYRDISKKLLLKLIQAPSQIDSIASVLDCKFNAKRESDFLIALMNSPQGEVLIHPFLHLLNSSTESIESYSAIIKETGKKIISDLKNADYRYLIPDFIKSTVRLYDNGMHNKEIIEICLNIWDEIYKNNLQGSTLLIDMMDSLKSGY